MINIDQNLMLKIYLRPAVGLSDHRWETKYENDNIRTFDETDSADDHDMSDCLKYSNGHHHP